MKRIERNRKKYRKKAWPRILAVFCIIAIVAVGFSAFYRPKINLNDKLARPTEIYDGKGVLASRITSNKTEGVPIDKIPESMKNAVISIEDRRFYEHHGIDYQGIMRALLTDIKARGVVEGGSTITQQLVKISLLKPERTFKRKWEEFFLAREVERKYKKSEIMEMYLNQVYFGHGAWGIQKASEIYFGKDPSKLTLSESAALAGMINAPSALDPYKYMDKTIERRNLVLSRMKSNGKLKKGEYSQARNERLKLDGRNLKDPLKGKFPYYVNQVLREAAGKYHLNTDELLRGGYKIFTALDQGMQADAENVYNNELDFLDRSNKGAVQSSAVLMDPKSGGIQALIGGRGEHVFLGYNRASQLRAQPGSAMKPLAVYTPALEEGYEITSELKDEKMKFGNYEPSNLNGQYEGQVPMYEAAMKSLNVPTVWLLNEIGADKGVDALKRFGIPLDKKDKSLALALGGMDKGVSPLDMAEAYSAFANNGTRSDAHTIVKIENSEGKEIAHWTKKKTKVTTKKVAEKITSMLLGVVKYGTGKNAAVPGYEIAGKTGSAQAVINGRDQGVKDQWFVGYTPKLVGAVWAGTDKTDSSNYLTTHSSEGAAIVFKKIMSKALAKEHPESFNVQDIGPLIEERQKEKEQQDKWKYWLEQGGNLKKNFDKWKNRIFKWK
ncbi:penicillin-binding protein 2A [Bacillus sp. OV322]|uniref:transglycosylase domain-containing protein n=1 Tax=Bacillus sp. OV322 TaxID=1882764 RepID=UPI0008E01825|nr:PBP1A family penicillin-binding protein [Bacillus sp. OV322]SFB94062.1 penicillin-binding protein 2A [Bacillus sp. OV322]